MNDPPPPHSPRAPGGARAPGWANPITTCWRASFEGILETGHLLIAAKEALEHGEFGRMIESDLPFKANTAQRLMAISRDEWISNPAHAPLLPPVWSTLYEMTKLDHEQLDKAAADGVIRPEMERREITPRVKKAKRTERERDFGEKKTGFPEKKY